MTLEELHNYLRDNLRIEVSRLFIKEKKPRYVMGRVVAPWAPPRENIRLDTETGRVQFVLWRVGEQGHSQDYWHNMGEGWEEYFIGEEQ